MNDAFERAAAKERSERHQRRHERAARGNALGLRIHLTVYIAVQLLLVGVWAVLRFSDGGTAHPWFIYPLLGWGVGLAAHYAAVSGRFGGAAARGD